MNELLEESESLAVFAPFLLNKSLQNVLGIIYVKCVYRGLLLIRNARKDPEESGKKTKGITVPDILVTHNAQQIMQKI